MTVVSPEKLKKAGKGVLKEVAHNMPAQDPEPETEVRIVTAPQGTIALTQNAYDAATLLLDNGFYQNPQEVSKSLRAKFQSNALQELKVLGVITNEGTRGRAGNISILVQKEQLSVRPVTTRGRKRLNKDFLPSGAVLVHPEDFAGFRENVISYLADTTPDAVKAYNLARSKKYGPAQLAALAGEWATEGISDEEAQARLTRLTTETLPPFEVHITEKYGPKMVKIFGY